jgi:guanylate kinase
MEQLPDLCFSVSYTTRSPRANEREGKDYYFVSPSVFQKMVERNEFLEWAEVLGHHYGTALTTVSHFTSKGIDLVLDIDSQGAKKVKEKVDQTVLIYILPPSMEALRERLVKRGLDSPEMIQLRLASAHRDIEEAYWYQYLIVNDQIEVAVEKLKAIIIAERCRKVKNSILKEKESEWGKHYGKNNG